MTKFKEQDQQKLKVSTQRSYVASEINGRLDFQSEQEKQARKNTDKPAEEPPHISVTLSNPPYSIGPENLKVASIQTNAGSRLVDVHEDALAKIGEILERKDVKDWYEGADRVFDKGNLNTFVSNVIDAVKGMDIIKDSENSTLSERWMIIYSAVQQIFGGGNSRIATREYITAIQKLETTEDGVLIKIGGAHHYRRKAGIPLDAYIRIATEKSEEDLSKRHYLNFVDKVEKQYFQITNKKLTIQEIFKASGYDAQEKIDFAVFPYAATEEETRNWLKANEAWLKYAVNVLETSKDNKSNISILPSGIKFDNKQVQEFENLLKVHEKHKSNGLKDYSIIGFKNTTPPAEIMATLEEYLPASDDLELVIKGLVALRQPGEGKIEMYEIMNILPEGIRLVPIDTKNTESSENHLATIEFVKSLGRNFEETFQPIKDLWLKYFNEESEQGENKTITDKTVLQGLGGKWGLSSDKIKLLATIYTEIPQLMRYAETLKQYKPVEDGVVPMNYLKRLKEDPLLQDLQLFDAVWKKLNGLEESLQAQLEDDDVSVDLDLERFFIKSKEELDQLNEIISLGNVSKHLTSSVLNSSYDGLRGYVIETMNSLKARNPKAEESPLYKKLESDLGEFLGFNPDQIAEISPTIRATTVITTHLQLYKLLQELR